MVYAFYASFFVYLLCAEKGGEVRCRHNAQNEGTNMFSVCLGMGLGMQPVAGY